MEYKMRPSFELIRLKRLRNPLNPEDISDIKRRCEERREWGQTPDNRFSLVGATEPLAARRRCADAE